jgi:mannose-6-phosphate isomerase-like protein (cupin superfamily)
MPDKHLVLDPDVHESLKSKKRERGMTLREIGNAALRSALDRPALSDAIARQLIAAGKISSAEYDRARKEALEELEASHRSVAECLQPTESGTLSSGSWEIAGTDPRGGSDYHILEAWAVNGNRDPLPLHCHENSDEFIIVVAGEVLVALEEGERTLERGATIRIERGTPHAVTPMNADTQIVVVCSPPDSSILEALKRTPQAAS